MFTAQIICLENPRYAANRSQCFTTVMLLGIGLFTLPLLMATAPGLNECIRAYSSVPACGILAILVFVCSIGPFLLMNRWQREVSATEAGLVYCAEPVLASLLALLTPVWLSHWCGINYPNEQLTVCLLVGGGLVTTANILLQTRWLEVKQFES
jgi:drug/metabolite transporter (DMT)-like permease